MKRSDLQAIILEALIFLGGQGTIIQICKYIWDKYEEDLRASGDLFYHWQYDMRWAGQQLRNAGKLVESRKAPRGLWIVRG